MLAAALAVLLWTPSARADAFGDACSAAGQGSGCLGTIDRRTSERPEREKPECDAACRQQAIDDDNYANAHIVEPAELPLPSPTEIREQRTIASARKDDLGRDVILASAGLMAMRGPVRAPFWLVGFGGLFVGSVLLSYPSSHLQDYASAIWNTFVSPERARERLILASAPEPTEHDRELGTDLDSGQYRPGEAAAGRRLEQRVGPLKRDGTKTGDWVDANGKIYDGVGPVPSEHFDPDSVNDQVDKHLRKQGVDVVVVDLTGLTPEQRTTVEEHVNGLPQEQKDRVIVQGE